MFTESKAVNEETVKIRQEFVLDSSMRLSGLLSLACKMAVRRQL